MDSLIPRLKKICLTGLAVAGSFTTSAYACSSVEKRASPAIRVEKKSVEIRKGVFAIVTEHGIIRARALHSDKKGLYVLAKGICQEKDAPRYWRCQECGKFVEGYQGMKEQGMKEQGMKEHVNKKGQDHRFFYPVHFDGD